MTDRSAYSKKRYAANREKMKQQSADARLMRWYGITRAQYDTMYFLQSGCCLLCGDEVEGKNCHVDHDHVTGKVRGLLCAKCNKGLGLFKESPELLRLAADYLESGDENAGITETDRLEVGT